MERKARFRTRNRLLWLLLVAQVALQASAQAPTIVQTNDDGWAVANIRAQFEALEAAGYDNIISAPAVDKSGTGSSDAEPATVGDDGCEYDSCAPGSPATGSNSSNSRINYVNSFPVTAVRYGIETLAPEFFNGSGPDLVVSGPNVGFNTGDTVEGSATVGAACEAAKEGIPALAISGDGGKHVSYTTLDQPSDSTTSAHVFAALGVRLLSALLSNTSFALNASNATSQASSTILPSNIVLNVNYASTGGNCTDADAYVFVLTRLHRTSAHTAPDVETCNRTRLPSEGGVFARNPGKCAATVSVMNATTKGDVGADTQAFVLERLGGLLSCGKNGVVASGARSFRQELGDRMSYMWGIVPMQLYVLLPFLLMATLA